MRKKVLALCCLQAISAWAEESVRLDEVSVTATREERPTSEVPQAIAVVGKSELAEKKMFNVKEALQGIPGVLIDSKNGGFDARLVIRGAGLKAPYGIREIMVLRDGVPLTDPDSLTRLDFVDTQDIERIEVAKGPGNLFAAGSAGGAIQIFSKSVFDEAADNFKAGLGTEGARNLHLRYGTVGETHALALTATHRRLDNDWRRWNRFDTTQLSLKHGFMLTSGTLESELSYAETNMEIPGVMDQALYETFLRTGRQTGTSEPWKHAGRYSKVWFLNSKFEREFGDFIFKPRVYYNTWYHYHPVTGAIIETEDWVWNLGADIEGQWRHAQGSLVGGVTLRKERTPDSRKYQYRDVAKLPSGRITSTLSDARGQLAEIDDATSLLTGLYLQESWRPTARWIVDLGLRYDVIRFEDDNEQFWKYDYASGKYVAGAGVTHREKTFRLPAPKLAVSYKLADTLHLYGMIAEAGQVPSQSEFSTNPALEAPRSRNYEIGLKGRAPHWEFDASVYLNPVENEIVQQVNGGVTTFLNAGKTDKKGLELTGRIELDPRWEIGGHYAYADYTYERFSEPVRVGSSTVNMDRSGKRLPFVPRHQYGAFVGWKPAAGWRVRLSSNTWGKYWLDSANSATYEGWKWVTNLAVSYEKNGHTFTFHADNLFDKHYAAEVKKDTTGKVTYAAAAPRTLMLTYKYAF